MFENRLPNKQRFNFQKGDGAVPLTKHDFLQILSDAFDNVLYNSVSDERLGNHDEDNWNRKDKIYYSNSTYWKETLLDYNYVGQRIVLKNFAIIEWLPASPGLFFTGKAEKARRKAERYVNPDYNEYLPLGKLEMILGGIGSVRLGSEKEFDRYKHYMCATSNGASHEGIPVIFDRHIYLQIIDEIKTKGYCKGNVIGTIEILHTERSIITFDRKIPKYCLMVDSFERTQDIPEIISVTIAAAFQSDEFRNYRLVDRMEDNFAWTYCTFNPHINNGRDLDKAVEWIMQYTHRYSYNARIVSDFDEHKNHFESVDFTLKQIMSNRFNKELLEEYEHRYQININKVIMGDNFENISGTVINRSVVTNSLNKVSHIVDEEAAELLKQITSEVENSGNKDAAENMAEFHKELQKPEPKKSLLKSFWNGVVTAVPALITNADKVLSIIEKVGNIMPH